MTFGSPLWLWALWALPLLAFFFARAEQRGAERLQQFVAARLLPQLAGTVNRGRRIFRFALLLLVLPLVIVSLPRPRWGSAFAEVRPNGLPLILAVDVSPGLLSHAAPPSARARATPATHGLPGRGCSGGPTAPREAGRPSGPRRVGQDGTVAGGPPAVGAMTCHAVPSAAVTRNSAGPGLPVPSETMRCSPLQ